MNRTKTLALLVTFIIGIISFSCQAKNISKTEANTNNTVEIIEETEKPAPTVSTGKEPECEKLYGADSLKTIQQTAIYREEFKRKNYVDALTSWRYVYANAPCFREYITADGAFLFNWLIGQTAKTETDKIKAYADTLMKIYDTRLRLFGESANVIGRKGRDMFKYFPDKRSEVIELLKKALEGEGNASSSGVVTDLMLAMVQQNKADKTSITDDDVINMFDKLMGIIEYNITDNKNKFDSGEDTAKYGTNMRYWQWTEGYIVDLSTPYLTCEKLTLVYQPKFKAKQEDTVLLAKIITLLKRSPNCSKTPFYLEVAEQNFKLNPSAEAAAALAKAFQDKNDEKKAVYYFTKAAEMEKDNNKKADYYIVIASYELSNTNCTQARTFARKAIELNPKSGQAYLIIGSAYMTCASSCGGTTVEKAYAYLAAYDKFVQAKSADPSVADQANNRMAQAQARWPKRSDVFFENLKDGQTVNTGCWIGESTVLRSTKD